MQQKKLFMLFGALCLFNLGHAGHPQTPPQDPVEQETIGTVTPGAGPKVTSGADFYLTADFIYWKTMQEGTHYTTTNASTPPNDPLANNPKGKSKVVGYSWNPGFKVGIGLNLCHGDWDVFAQYTWLRPKNSESSSGPIVSFDFFANTSSIKTKRVAAKWKLDFDVIDVELGRNFYLNHTLTMRPFIGLKGTWQDYKETIVTSREDYSLESDFGGFAVPVSGPQTDTHSSNISGIGFRGGLNLAWYMSKNWSIFGNLAWSILSTKYSDLKYTSEIANVSTNTKTVTDNVKRTNGNYTNKFVGETEIGLRWELWFSNNDYHFSVQAGWEQQTWINWINQLDDVWDQYFGLNFHGLTLKFRFDF